MSKHLKIGLLTLLISYCLLNILVINITTSVPVGLYMITFNNLQINDYVKYKPTGELLAYSLQKKYLLNGMSFIKKIAALEGDTYYIRDNYLYINQLNKGRVYNSDFMKIETNKVYHVSNGNALLLTEHPRSFDSRYYGEVPIESLVKIIPIITKGQAS